MPKLRTFLARSAKLSLPLVARLSMLPALAARPSLPVPAAALPLPPLSLPMMQRMPVPRTRSSSALVSFQNQGLAMEG